MFQLRIEAALAPEHRTLNNPKPMMLRLLRVQLLCPERLQTKSFPDMLARCPWMYTTKFPEAKNTHDVPASKMQLLTE